MLVDTHPYPAVRRCPDAKTDFDGKDLFNVAQAVHSISGSKRQISFLATLDTCFSVQRNTLSFEAQAASTVNLTEGYPCVLTNCTTLRYESMWTRQGRVYLLTYWDHESQYSVLYRYQYLATSVLWLHYEYFSVQTSSLISFNACFSLGRMSLDFTLLKFFPVINTNPLSEASRFSLQGSSRSVWQTNTSVGIL